MSARREALTLMIGAMMLVAAAGMVNEAHERAQNAPMVTVGEHAGGAADLTAGQ
ncbi:hypothetical protein [Mycobacterium aquaticum]|uniref:hypothetical protein n=1 Tax=Mycobacterium aquaticum TaxID=1927124 RepID=UPI0014759703|nr:hypothetical protein [Mycobacterium aquaticum]